VVVFWLCLLAESPDAGNSRIHIAEDLRRLARPDYHDSTHGTASLAAA
jgi:hypothetical protein